MTCKMAVHQYARCCKRVLGVVSQQSLRDSQGHKMDKQAWCLIAADAGLAMSAPHGSTIDKVRKLLDMLCC